MRYLNVQPRGGSQRWITLATAVAVATFLAFAPACGPQANGTTGAGAALTPGQKVALTVSESPLGAVPAGVNWDNVVVSSDGNRTAVGGKQDGKWIVSVDGTAGKPYDAVEKLFARGLTAYEQAVIVFSPDSRRVAHLARRGAGWIVVADGVESGPYDDVMADSLVFSPDSKHLAYAAKRGANWFVVADGSERGRYERVADVVFSPDSARLAYAATVGASEFAVVDGKPGPAYHMVTGLLFSPDSKRLAYRAERGIQWMVVLDGAEGRLYDELWTSAMYMDGSGGSVSASSGSSPTFSPDSRHLAYTGKRSEQWFVVLDGTESEAWDDVSGVKFSPQGGRLSYGAQRKEQRFAVIDGKPGKAVPLLFLNRLLLSDDGKRVLYMVNRAKDGPTLIVVDGVEGPQHEGIVGSTCRFSADGKRTGYVATRTDKRLLVVDGVAGSEYDDIRGPWFSPDGACVASLAKRAGQWHVVVNGTETQGYDRFPDLDRLVFDGPAKLHTIGVRNGTFSRVEVRIAAAAGIK